MTPEEAIKIVNQFANDDEIDKLLVDLLRAPSPQTELQEADPNLKKFVPARCAAVGNADRKRSGARRHGEFVLAVWREYGEPGLLLMGYAMTFPAGGMKSRSRARSSMANRSVLPELCDGPRRV